MEARKISKPLATSTLPIPDARTALYGIEDAKRDGNEIDNRPIDRKMNMWVPAGTKPFRQLEGLIGNVIRRIGGRNSHPGFHRVPNE